MDDDAHSWLINLQNYMTNIDLCDTWDKQRREGHFSNSPTVNLASTPGTFNQHDQQIIGLGNSECLNSLSLSGGKGYTTSRKEPLRK